MYPCHCQFRKCNGALLKRSTVNYHKNRDLRQLSIPLATNTQQPPSSHTPINNLIPPNSSLPSCNPPVNQQDTHTTTSVHPQDVNHDLGVAPSFVDAEERGRIIMEHAAQDFIRTATITSFPYDDTWEEPDDEDNLGGEPSTLSGHPPLPLATSLSNGSEPVPPTLSPGPTFSDPGNPLEPSEDFPDPFHTAHEERATPLLTLDSTPTPLYLLYILVSWLHTQFHLPFLACNAVLTVVFFILQTAGVLLHPEMPLYYTLGTVLSHTGVEPTFTVLPVCPTCLEVYPITTAQDLACTVCGSPLFRSRRRLDRTRTEDIATQPLLRYATKTLESQLRDILNVPGMEEVLEEWRSRPRSPGEMVDIFDGDVCKTIPGPDGRPFFENPRHKGELRIGLSLGLDWYACIKISCISTDRHPRFSYLRSQIAPSHSSCPISFNIINFPEYLK